jgi:SAM-dependent methyltransferase
MLEWTGERFVPWAKEPAVAYEHLHRYAWASTLAKGKSVLDLASGEGYGSNMLSAEASVVVGIEIDEQAVRHAAAKYLRPNLKFIQGSITRIPLEEKSFDLIVCFEAIEHIEEHEQLLCEVKRLLKPDGLLLVSTPNKTVYSHPEAEHNPFHVKELTFDEFNGLLSRHFAQVRFLGQSVVPGSDIWPIGSADGVLVQAFPVERGESEFKVIQGDQRVATYFIGIASDSADRLPQEGSILIDHSNELVEGKNREIRELLATNASAQQGLEWQAQQLRNRDIDIESQQKELALRAEEIAELKKGLDWSKGHIEGLNAALASQNEALRWRAHQVEDFEKEKAVLLGQLRSVQQDLGSTAGELEAIKHSRGWKLVLQLRRLRNMFRSV